MPKRVLPLLLSFFLFIQNIIYPWISILPAPPPVYAEESPPEATTSARLVSPPLEGETTPATDPLDNLPFEIKESTNSAQITSPETQPETNLTGPASQTPEPTPETPIPTPLNKSNKKMDFGKLNKVYKANEFLEIDLKGKPLPKVEMFDYQHHKTNYQVKTAPNKLLISHAKNLKPGVYQLEITNEDGSVETHDYSWGVLAVNSNKSVYSPNETATLSIGVLDEQGNTICDAGLELTVTDPSGNETTLSTLDSTIASTSVCGNKEVTISPDYTGSYQTSSPGTYQIALSAQTQNGSYTTSDHFAVENKPAFDVERLTATRIYPVQNYPVILKITPTQDYSGPISEKLPGVFSSSTLSLSEAQSFVEPITDQNYYSDFTATTNSTDQTLTWSVNMVQGQTYYLGYLYDSPDQSPFAFEIGPLTIGSFTESRSWQLAVDAIARGTTVSTWSTSSTTTGPSGTNFAHTVDANTTLLLVAIGMDADEAISAVPVWNGSETMTLVHASTANANSGDERVYTYGLVSPTAASNYITFTMSSDDHAYAVAVNYLGTISSSVADATNFISEAVNNSATTTTILSSGGSAGSTLFVNAVFEGGDGDTASNNASFAELADTATGTSTLGADDAFYVADLIGGAPSAVTIDWAGSVSDENAGQLIEILPAPTTITITGTANGNNGASIRYAYDGVLQSDTSDTIGGGTWSIDSVTTPTSGQTITVWVDGVSDSNESTAVTNWSSGDVSGMILDTNVTTIGSSEDTSLTLTNLNQYDCTEDEDIMYQAASSTLKVEGDSCAGSTTNSYSTEELEILSGDTLTVGTSETLTTYDLTITGTLTSSGNSTYNVSHNWAKTGTFTSGTSTVNLTGSDSSTQTLSGSTGFNNLTISTNSNSAGRTITHTAGTTQTVTGTWTVTGYSGKVITLGSSTTSPWTINPTAASVTYASISYSTNSGSAFCATNSTNAGNNTGWIIVTDTNCPSIGSTGSSFQRKTWYDGTRYWRSFLDTVNSRIRFEYSTNGTSWTENTSAQIAVNTADFSIEGDSSNLFIVYTGSNDTKGRKASSYPGTGFTWGTEQVVFNGTGASDDYSYPVVTRDSSSYVWVGARYTGSSVYYVKTIKEAGGTNDLPEDSADTVYSLADTGNTSSTVYTNIVSTGSQNMYTTLGYGTALTGCYWDNSGADWLDAPGGSTCTSGSSSLDNNLVSYYKMDETGGWNGSAGEVIDSGPSGYNGTASGDATTNSSGKWDYAGIFDADTGSPNDYFTTSGTNLDNLYPVTYSMWFNPQSASSDFGGLVSKNSWVLDRQDSDDHLEFYVHCSTGNFDIQTPAGSFSLNTWQHVALTWDGSCNTTGVAIYIDGSAQTLSSGSGSLGGTPDSDSGASLYVGYSDIAGSGLVGKLDDLRIYDYALTGTDITALQTYDPSAGGSGTSTSIDTIPGNLLDTFSVVGDGSGNIFMEYISDEATDQVSHSKFNGSTWSTPALVADAADNNDAYPTLTLDTTNSDLYAFWVDTSTSHVYYSVCDTTTNCDAASEWSGETDWQTSGTNTYLTSNISGAEQIFAEWVDGTTIMWDQISFATNTAPDSPTSLAQKTTGDVTITTGQWVSATSIKFTATATDTDNPDTLYLCVEKDDVDTAFSNTEDSCGSGVAYSGSGVTVTLTISSQTDATEYHWQARLKDEAGEYSSWVSYGGNSDTTPNADTDYGLDTTAPTGGAVYDGTSAGVDSTFSTSSLSALSGNWDSFDNNVSELSHYDYSIGTSAGATDVKGWTGIGTSTSVTAGSLTLQTSVVYFFNIRAVDNAGNTGSTVSSNGQLVAPSLSFAVSPASITFDNLNTGNSYTDTAITTLTTSTNAYGGYVLRAFVSDYLTSDVGGFTIPDFTGGTYASPAVWGSSTGFGYTSSDTTIQGSDKFGSGTLYAPFSQTGPGDIVADHTANVSGSPISGEEFDLTYQVTAPDSQEAYTYSTTVIYTATVQY